MTFSLKPRRWSTLPSVAASVRTRVVSWKRAAEMKRIGLERGLGDAEQHRGRFGGLAALASTCAVFLLEVEPVDLVAPEEAGVARIGDLHLAQHLADDDLDVLVVDFDALEAVDLLHFVDEMLLQILRSADIEDFMRDDGAFGELLALLHEVALEDDDVLVERDEMLLLRAGVGSRTMSLRLPRTVPPISTMPSILAISAASFGRRASKSSATRGRPPVMSLVLAILRGVLARRWPAWTFLSFLHCDVRAGGNRVAGKDFLVLVDDDDLRMQIFLVLDDDGAHHAGRFVHLALDGDAVDHVAEFDLAGLFREDRHVVRIPLHEGLALLDLAAVGHGDDRADDDGVAFEFAAILGVNGDGAVLVEHDPVAVERLDRAQVVEATVAVVLGLDHRLLEGLRRRAADVEGTHGQLRAGLADGLRGDDADRLAELDHLAGGQVAAVALGADAALGFAGEHGADLELLDADLLDRRRRDFVDELVRLRGSACR